MRIRARTWNAFRLQALEDFTMRMLAHTEKFFPAACARLGERTVRDAIAHGIERAGSYGITRERGVCAWVDLMFTFGRDFDLDPALPWASSYLGRADVPHQRDRIERLLARSLQHIDEARGIEHGYSAP